MTSRHRPFALLLLALAAVPTAAVAQSFKPYTMPGIFRVSFPGDPETEDETDGNYRSRQWMVETEGALYAVSVDEVSGSEAPKPDAWFFEQVLEEVKGLADSEEVKVREVTYAGATGRGYSGEGVEAIAFTEGGTRSIALYVLWLEKPPAEMKAFFDSLELLGAPGSSASSSPAQSQAKSGGAGGGGLARLFGGGRKTDSLAGFERFKPDPEFSLLMPRGTTALDPRTTSRPAGHWAGQHADVRYAIHFFTSEVKFIEAKTPSDYLEDQMNFLVERDRGRLIDSSRISLSGYPGREFTSESAQTLTDFRIYLVGTRVYMLSVARARGVEAQAKDGFFDSLELHYKPPKVATKKGVTSKSSRASSNELRARRPFALGVEGGWNGLTGLGAVATYYVIPYLALDAGVGRSNSGIRTSARARLLPLTGNFSPHVGVGVQYGFGLSEPVEREQIPELPPGTVEPVDTPPGTTVPTYELGVGSQLRLQGVVGVDLVTDGGFSLVLNVGYSYPVGGNNFRYGGYTPTVDERQADALNFGGGYVASVQLGYAF